MRKFVSGCVAGLAVFFAASTQASCGSAYCMLNTNWSAQGVWTQPGARLDLRYEAINQDELLHGSHDDASAEDHREKNTLNHNIQATFDYAFNETYGVSVHLPVVSREHTHFHVDLNDSADSEKEVWDFSKIGDVRVVGRMQLSSPTQLHDAYGVTLGFKLPSGDYTLANRDGEIAERSLQPGTGTTDIIIGGYFRQQLLELNGQWFVQASAVSPFNQRDEYRAGNQWFIDVGYRQHVVQQLSAMLQLNINHKNRDSGLQSEPENSGGNGVFLSPGCSYSLTPSLQVYSFVHYRLSQMVNGEQLSAKNSFVVGLSTTF